MPQNPLNALKKASSISSNPSSPDPSLISRGQMPVPPWGSIMSGVGQAAQGAATAAPEALQGLAKAVPSGIQQLGPETTNVMNRMYQVANPAFKALQDAGTFIGDRTTGLLQSLPKVAQAAVPAGSEASTYTGPVAETLGEVDPFHTPVGGEGLYNVARAGLRGIVDPVEEAYKALLSRGGK